MATTFDPETLTQIGRYPVVRFIAEGGMSWIYEVRDENFYNARRALKLIKPHVLEEGELRERFEGEVRLLAQIEHPNLVRVYDRGEDPATRCLFFTMEVIEGPHLGQIAPIWLRDPDTRHANVTFFPLAAIVEFFVGVLGALARVHAQRVYHRDIKPENVLISQDGIAKLCDFSIARDTHTTGVTRAGYAVGTPDYMSPEQSREEPVGAQSDIFSLGLTLYTVLTGGSIYASELGDDRKTMQVIRHLWTLYQNRAEYRFRFPDEVPPGLRDVIRRACRMDPAARYQTATEMREALATALAAERDLRQSAPAYDDEEPDGGYEEDADEEEESGPFPWLGVVLGVAAAGFLGLGGLLALQPGIRERIRDLFVASDSVAPDLLKRAERRLGEVNELIAWLGARPEADARTLAADAKGDLRRPVDDLEQAKIDLRDETSAGEKLALRELDRAEQGFATVCDRFSSEYLDEARNSAEGAARAAHQRIGDDARANAPEAEATLEQAYAGLSSEIGNHGCARALGLRDRIEAAAVVIASVEALEHEAAEVLPRRVDEGIRVAEAAATRAAEQSVEDESYAAKRREGDDALAEARTAYDATDFATAQRSSARAREAFERATLIGAALRSRQTAQARVEELEALDAPLGGELLLRFKDAQAGFTAGNFAEASRGFDALAPELDRRVTAARPAREAQRAQTDTCADAAGRGVDLAELEPDQAEARAKYRAAKFDEAAQLYRELEARCLELVARSEADAETAATAKSERERARTAAEKAQRVVAALATRLARDQVGAPKLDARLEAARAQVAAGDFAASESAFGALERDYDGTLKSAQPIVSLRDKAASDYKSATNAGTPPDKLRAGDELRTAGTAELARGELEPARAKFADSIASIRAARDEHERLQKQANAVREQELQARREQEEAQQIELAKRRNAAEKARDGLARSVSDLQAKGLPLGAVTSERASAQAAFEAQRYEDAAAAFTKAAATAGAQLDAGRPVLSARKAAEDARKGALGRGASGESLARASKAFDGAASALKAGDLNAALGGFRTATSAYDAADADPKEIVAQVLSAWDRAWSTRDIDQLRRVQSLTGAQESGFTTVFKDNDAISQETRVLDIQKDGPNAYQVAIEYDRVLAKGASKKPTMAQRRVARIERGAGGWVIASVSQK